MTEDTFLNFLLGEIPGRKQWTDFAVTMSPDGHLVFSANMVRSLPQVIVHTYEQEYLSSQ